MDASDGRFVSWVAVNEASERVYVLAGETIWVFGPPAAPVVDRELTAEIRASEAKLGALVNPGGLQTTYRFEYGPGPTSAYGSSTPFPEGSVGKDWKRTRCGRRKRPDGGYDLPLPGGRDQRTRPSWPDQTVTTLTAEEAAVPTNRRVEASPGGCPTAAPTSS